jgi:hypothetical protein
MQPALFPFRTFSATAFLEVPMRKLRLNLEELHVESFDTDDAAAARGTVVGNEEFSWSCPTDDTGCRTPGYASCQQTRCYWCSSPDTYAPSCNFTACCVE